RISIEGKELKNVLRVPRLMYRDNKEIWLLTNDSTLKIVTIKPSWEDSDYIYLEMPLDNNERIISSEINYPIDGMKLNIYNSGKED
ncbi:MAG: hypothetical protein ACRC37_02980, partial [Lentisphaeria bacterium]